jgi:hypothetical protein
MTKTRRKQCSTKGCRKRAVEGNDYCADCAPSKEENGANAEPAIEKFTPLQLTEAELDKFNALRMKMEMTLQSIRVLTLEQDKAARAFRDEQYRREQLIKQHQAAVEPLNENYLAYVRKLAEKYKLDPKKMGIEDETGVITDLRQHEDDSSD